MRKTIKSFRLYDSANGNSANTSAVQAHLFVRNSTHEEEKKRRKLTSYFWFDAHSVPCVVLSVSNKVIKQFHRNRDKYLWFTLTECENAERRTSNMRRERFHFNDTTHRTIANHRFYDRVVIRAILYRLNIHYMICNMLVIRHNK